MATFITPPTDPLDFSVAPSDPSQIMTFDPATGLNTGPGASFGDNFVSMADDLGYWLSKPLDLSRFVSFADNTGAAAVTSPNAPAEIGSAVSSAVSDAEKQLAKSVLPWALAGGAILLVVMAARK